MSLDEAKKIDLEEVKKIEFEILKYFDDVCRKAGIDYYLDCGTLLGAVRHKGYIPWDDDIDVCVKRADYRKVLQVLNEQQSPYKAISVYNDDSYYYPFAKIVNTRTFMKEAGMPDLECLGVYVDIFPIDYFPANNFKRKICFYKIYLYKALRSYALGWQLGKYPKGRKILCKLADKYGFLKANKKLDGYCEKISAKNTEYCGNVIASGKKYWDMKSECFDKTCEVSFEGKDFLAPHMYAEYLTQLYGDYMKLPPKEKQVNCHSFEAYWKE